MGISVYFANLVYLLLLLKSYRSSTTSLYRFFLGPLQIGREEAGAKSAPRKCKVQIMLQVPQDDIQSAAILFKVKKRWDI
jgi:hypothetical protein